MSLVKKVLLLFMLYGYGITVYAESQGEESVVFAVMGDMPYFAQENIDLTAPDGIMYKKIRALDPVVLIHYGDMISGGTSCTDEILQQQKAQIFALNPYRIVYTPGDNEWTDCDRKHLDERFYELGRLDFLRQLFYEDKSLDMSRDIQGLIRQKEMPENSRFKIGDLLFGTLHIVGTNNGRVNIVKGDVNATLDAVDKRDELNQLWLEKLFVEAKEAEGLVIVFHSDIYRFKGDVEACNSTVRVRCNPFKTIRDTIERMASLYQKPVLIVHGDTNAYCFNRQSEKIPNLWHLNGPGDFKVSDVAKVVFDLKNKENPFMVTGLISTQRPPKECSYKR